MGQLGPGRALRDVWHARDEEERGIDVQAPFQNITNGYSVETTTMDDETYLLEANNANNNDRASANILL